MGLIATVMFSAIGTSSFFIGASTVRSSRRRSVIKTLEHAEKQDVHAKAIDSLPTSIYSPSDLVNLSQKQMEFMLEMMMLKAHLIKVMRRFEELPDTVPSEILRYNFIDMLSKYMSTCNKEIENILENFSAQPDHHNQFRN